VTPSVAVRLAGLSALKIAPAGKPGCYGPADSEPLFVAARLAGVRVFKIAPAGKPGCYGLLIANRFS